MFLQLNSFIQMMTCIYCYKTQKLFDLGNWFPKWPKVYDPSFPKGFRITISKFTISNENWNLQWSPEVWERLLPFSATLYARCLIKQMSEIISNFLNYHSQRHLHMAFPKLQGNKNIFSFLIKNWLVIAVPSELTLFSLPSPPLTRVFSTGFTKWLWYFRLILQCFDLCQN